MHDMYGIVSKQNISIYEILCINNIPIGLYYITVIYKDKITCMIFIHFIPKK